MIKGPWVNIPHSPVWKRYSWAVWSTLYSHTKKCRDPILYLTVDVIRSFGKHILVWDLQSGWNLLTVFFYMQVPEISQHILLHHSSPKTASIKKSFPKDTIGTAAAVHYEHNTCCAYRHSYIINLTIFSLLPQEARLVLFLLRSCRLRRLWHNRRYTYIRSFRHDQSSLTELRRPV